MIGAIIAAILEAERFLDSDTTVSKLLLEAIRESLTPHRHEVAPNVEAQRGLAAGIAAKCSNVVQEYARVQAKKQAKEKTP